MAGFMSLCDYRAKVRALEKDKYAIREFSRGEICECIIDIFSANDRLSTWEHKYVMHLYRHYLSDMRVMQLDAASHRSVLAEMLSSFDIIAEVYGYCDCSSKAERKDERKEKKAKYREMACALIDGGGLFSREWWALCNRYCIAFWY